MGTGEPGLGAGAACGIHLLAIVINQHRVPTSGSCLWPKPPVPVPPPTFKWFTDSVPYVSISVQPFLSTDKAFSPLPWGWIKLSYGRFPTSGSDLQQHLWMAAVVCLHNGLHSVMNHLCVSPFGRQFTTQNAFVVALELVNKNDTGWWKLQKVIRQGFFISFKVKNIFLKETIETVQDDYGKFEDTRQKEDIFLKANL